jgi:hypothetical protein
MFDVNFLPEEQKIREHQEEKQNILAKENAGIKMSNPVVSRPQKQDLSAKENKLKIGGFFKKLFKKNKIEKPKAPTIAKSEMVFPGSNNHKINIQVKDASLKEKAEVDKPLIDINHMLAEKPTVLPDIKENIQNEPKIEVVDLDNQKNNENEQTKNSPEKLPVKDSAVIDAKFLNNLKEFRNRDIEINLISEESQLKEMDKTTKIMVFSAVTAGMILIFGGLFFIIGMKTKSAMNEKITLENTIVEINKKIREENQNNKAVSELQPRLNSLKQILDAHPYAGKVFDYLESNTAPGVYYDNMDVDVANKKISLQGSALDYTQAAQQILIFSNDKENIVVSEISAITKKKESVTEEEEKNGIKPREIVQFTVDLTMSDNFFKK